MATQDKDFKVKNGLQVGGPTNLVNYTSSSPSNPFIGQLWISASSLYAWTGSEWNLIGDGNSEDGPSGNFLTEESAASAYFRISSSVSNFGTIKTIPATENIEADLITDELTFAAENGIILNATASVDQLTVSTNATHLNTASAIVSRDANQSFEISAVNFETASTVFSNYTEPGSLFWGWEDGTLELTMNNEVLQSVGMDLFMPPTKNNSGVQIDRGDYVMATGVQGDRITIAKAVNDGSVAPDYFIGFAASNIPDGSETGLVLINGLVKQINTSAWEVGTILYPSSASPGKLTSIKPNPPSMRVPIAIVTRQQVNTGILLVRNDTGSTFGNSDSNALFTNLAGNDIAIYNPSASYWVNQNLASAIQQVDGEGSGIDADLLDGQHGSYYLDWNNFTNKPGEMGGGSVTLSASAPAITSDGQSYFNTTNYTFNISVDGMWLQVGSVPYIDGGSPQTSIYEGLLDGGEPSTTEFDNSLDLGSYAVPELLA